MRASMEKNPKYIAYIFISYTIIFISYLKEMSIQVHGFPTLPFCYTFSNPKDFSPYLHDIYFCLFHCVHFASFLMILNGMSRKIRCKYFASISSDLKPIWILYSPTVEHFGNWPFLQFLSKRTTCNVPHLTFFSNHIQEASLSLTAADVPSH